MFFFISSEKSYYTEITINTILVPRKVLNILMYCMDLSASMNSSAFEMLAEHAKWL